jgi:hypothetical protein
MPIYLFQHPKTKEVKEIIQRMSESHTYNDKGVEWERVFTKPQAAFNTQISATNRQEFVEKTRGKNYSVGQMWDMSAELSEKRGGTSGQDEVKAKAEQAYEKKTQKKHPHSSQNRKGMTIQL